MREKRMIHSLAVATKMKETYLERHPEDSLIADEMFTLGLLHDIGYETSDIVAGHSKRGGELLKRQGYKYWQEAYYHGNPSDDYSSEALDLLNMADMSIDSSGEDVGFNKRLEDILKRYGRDSYQYENAIRIIERLKKEVYYVNYGKGTKTSY